LRPFSLYLSRENLEIAEQLKPRLEHVEVVVVVFDTRARAYWWRNTQPDAAPFYRRFPAAAPDPPLRVTRTMGQHTQGRVPVSSCASGARTAPDTLRLLQQNLPTADSCAAAKSD